jgi:hypothetical protein
MSANTVLCHIGREIFYVKPDDVEAIKKIQQYCDEIALEKISQYLEAKYPNALNEVMNWED